MQLIKTMLRGRCTYWPPAEPDVFGKPTFGDPVELKCRWEDAAWMTVTEGGEVSQSRTMVYVDRDVAESGVLLNLRLAQVIDLAVPLDNDGAFEIKRFEKLPTLQYNQYVRVAYL